MKRFSVLSLCLLLSIEMLFALPLDDIPQSLQRKMDKAGVHYERVVKAELSRHFDEGSFLVDARVNIEKVALETKEVIIDPEIRQLPGLPVLPGELVSDSDNSTAFDTTYLYKLGAVNVVVLVDSSYSFDDFDFIRNVVGMVADLDAKRGDNILIKKKGFPRVAREVFKEEEAPEKESESSIVTDSEEEKGIPMFYWLLLLLAVIMIIFFIILMRQSKKEKRITIEDNSEIKDTLDTIIAEISTIKSGKTKDGSGDTPSEDEKIGRKLRAFVVHSFIGNPADASAVIKSWVQHRGDEGVINSAKLVKAVDDELLTIVKPDIEDELIKKIEWHVSHGDVQMDNMLEILKLFKQDFGMLTSKAGDTSDRDLFNFLKTMTNEQLLHIMKDEEDGVQALILSQLDAPKAAEVIQRFEDVKRTKILVGMGKIANIPVKVYKSIADKISKKALAVSNMKFVTADGVGSAIELIFSLPTSEHDNYVSSIAEADLEMAKKIRRFFVSFAELPSLPIPTLRRVLQNVEREYLVVSLVGVDPAFKTSLITHLPERMQEMVESSIASRADSKPADIELARKGVLREAQKELYAIGGRTL